MLAPLLPVPLAFAAALALRAMHARRPGRTGYATAALGWFALAPFAWTKRLSALRRVTV